MTAGEDFNLIDDPWIRAMDHLGKVDELSLADFFRRAHELKALAGELPTQDAAILRVLLAVAYAVFGREDADGARVEADAPMKLLEHWHKLWKLKRFSMAGVEKYFDRHRDRFGLFHPTTPFFQVAGLHAKDEKINPVTQMICDVPSREARRFFTNRGGREAASLSFAEAARWLIHLQAWDYAGKKATIVGGNPDGGGTGWLGKLGVVHAERENLFETLLLNMILLDQNGKPLPPGRPCWEMPPKPAHKVERLPDGYADLLTWQSRRVRLFRDGGRVTGILYSYGDVFEKGNTFVEQMSGWRPSSEKGKENRFIPNTHSADRSAWRDLCALLSRKSHDGKDNRPPGIVAWAAALKHKCLDELEILQLRTVGLEYGNMQAVVNELISDGVTVNAALLTELDKEWLPRILDAVQKTDQCVSELGRLASTLVEASGGSDERALKGAAAVAREQAFFALDVPFREWLSRIDPAKDDVDDQLIGWFGKKGDNPPGADPAGAAGNAGTSARPGRMRSILFGQAARMVGEAGVKAMVGVGKTNENTNKKAYINSCKALDYFSRQLDQIIGGKK